MLNKYAIVCMLSGLIKWKTFFVVRKIKWLKMRSLEI